MIQIFKKQIDFIIKIWRTKSNKQYYFLTKEIKNYNVTIDGQNSFDQLVRNDLKTYNIRKIRAGLVDDYTTNCLLDYNDFETYHKMIPINLSKQQTLDDPKAIQQINFTRI